MRIKLETFLFSLLLWKEKDAFNCMGVYPPAEKWELSKLETKKYDFPLSKTVQFDEKKTTIKKC